MSHLPQSFGPMLLRAALFSSIGLSLVALPHASPATVPQTGLNNARGWIMAQAKSSQAAQAKSSQAAQADRLFQQGMAQVQRNENDAALKSLQQSLAIYQATGHRSGSIDAIRYIGWAYHQLKDQPKALASFQQSLAIAQTINHRAGEAKALNGIGAVYASLKQLEQALASYEQAQSIAIEIKDRKTQTSILENLTTFYQSANNWKKAIAVLNQNLAIYRELQQPKDESYTLTALGIAYAKLGEDQQSIAFHQQSLAIDTQLNDQSGMANTWRNIGLSYDKQKDYTQAVSAFNQSLTLYRELKKPTNIAKLLNNLGLSYTSQKAYPQAIVAFEESRTLYTQLGDRPNIAQLWRNFSLVYEAQREMPQAIQAVERSLEIRRELKENELATSLLLSLALLQQKAKKYPQAITSYEAYLTASRQQPDFKQEALILKIIGDLYRSPDQTQANSDQALKYYNESLKIAEKRGNQSDINHAIHGMAMVYQQDNRFKLGVEHFNKALTGWRRLNDKSMEANALLMLGTMYASSTGNDGKTWCPDALGYLEQSLRLLRELKDQGSQTIAIGLLGTCAQAMEQPDRAIDYLQQSLAIARQNNDQLQAGIMLVNLGRAYQMLGDWAQAQNTAEQGLSIIRSLQNPQWEVFALDHLASIYVARAADQKAIDAQTQRITLAYQHNVRLVNPGFNAVMISVEQAKKFDATTYWDRETKRLRQQLTQQGFSTSLLDLIGPKATNLNQPNFFAPATLSANMRESFTVLGDAYVAAQKYPQAMAFYQLGLSVDIEKGDGVGFNDIDLLTKLGSTAVRMNRFTEAEAFLRLALQHGEAFRTELGYSKGSTTKQWTDADRIFLAERKVRNFQQLQQVLVRQNRTGEALELAEEARARTFVELLAARTEGQPLGDKLPPAPKLDAMRQIAKAQKATLVQYSIVGPDLLYIWVIKPTGEITFRSTQWAAKQSLKELVARSRAAIGVRGRIKQVALARTNDRPSAPQGNLAKLHQILIDPIAQDLPSDPNQRVVFLPQGELFLVPFAALPNAQGQYLIQRHTISTAPSIQTLEFTRTQAKQAKSNGRSVVVGDPTMPLFEGEPLPSLPGAREEAIAIAKLLNTTPLLGGQATKSAVLSQIQSASVIHLATHGLLDTVQGDIPGAIALAPSGQDNGLLSASEIFDLKLNAKLVVLSACDTGRGQITGDGVLGLSRSIVAAGVPTVLVSLWAVNDGSTSVFMSEFYRQLQQQPDKAQALRQAMLVTQQKYPNSSDWAAFTLVGEAE